MSIPMDHLRITPTQYKKICQIVGFKKDKIQPFNSEPIDIQQAVEITEYIVGEIHDNWVVETFKEFGYETRPLISLSMFMMFLLREFRIGVIEQGKRPPDLRRLNSSL
jgi:hypothetical protein